MRENIWKLMVAGGTDLVFQSLLERGKMHISILDLLTCLNVNQSLSLDHYQSALEST